MRVKAFIKVSKFLRYGSLGYPFGRNAFRRRDVFTASVRPLVGDTNSSAETFVDIEACLPPSQFDSFKQVLGWQSNKDEILWIGDTRDLVSPC